MNKFISTVLSGAFGGLIVFGATNLLQDKQETPVQPAVSLARQVDYHAAPVGFDFTRAAEKAMPAVVHIKASESRQAAVQRGRQQQNPFRFFFGDDFSNDGPRSGTGSGIIYTEDGYILTNNHVVDFADEFEVTLHDNREFKARLVGRDENSDMAVIKIDAHDLPIMEIANSDHAKVGEWVLAVGNPFDLASTVTAGIISAKGRDINIIKGQSAIESFIQTDAAVNPGNSGGALVDAQGRLLGINSAIATPNGVFAGYSFAIPINLAKKIADDLIKYGVFKRAYLGVSIETMDSELAEEAAVKYDQGVLIMQVLDENGSAARAGLKEKDIITSVNGKTINSVPELQEMISRSKVGDVLQMAILRNGQKKELPVRLRSRNEN